LFLRLEDVKKKGFHASRRSAGWAAGLPERTDMARRKRNFKFSWRSKKANHGRKGARGKLKAWGKKS
jgi:hypothetical protein